MYKFSVIIEGLSFDVIMSYKSVPRQYTSPAALNTYI